MMSNNSLWRDVYVTGLLSVASGVSHFYFLLVAGLFSLLGTEFSLTHVEAAILITVFYAVAGLSQCLAGFLVDRAGARRVLFCGLAMLGLSALLLASAHGYATLMIGVLLAGIGNGAFRPAGYALLNQRVWPARLGHAFAAYGLFGYCSVGGAAFFLFTITKLFNWRHAMLCAAFLPCIVLLILFLNRAALRSDLVAPQEQLQNKAPGMARNGAGALAFLRLPSVRMCLAFFVIGAIALHSTQSMFLLGLMRLYGMSLTTASVAGTLFMLASAVGMGLGGFFCGAGARLKRNVTIAYAVIALLALVLALGAVPSWLALLLMGAMGLIYGMIGPSRDMMIRALVPGNATGRVYGLVYGGIDTGRVFSPLMLGALASSGHPGLMFVCVAVSQVLAIGAALALRAKTRPVQLQKA